MAVIKCKNGHFYDDAKYSRCPHCQRGMVHVTKEDYEDDLDDVLTVAFPAPQSSAGDIYDDSITVALDSGAYDAPDEGKTIGFYNFEQGTQLLTGWLVATEGPARGRDYRLYHGWNRIGRSPAMQIYIPEDKRLSFENHGAVVFDEKKSMHYFINESGSPAYVNGENAVGSKALQSGDVIEIGDSKLTFIAFCTEERKWQEK